MNAPISEPVAAKRGPWLTRLAASPRFQSWAAHFPLTRRRARAEGDAMMGLVSGFVQSQALMALVELGVLEELRGGRRSAGQLAQLTRVPEARMDILARAGVAMGLMKASRKGYGLTIRGASLLGVPGLTDMIRHHKVFYRDLADPAAFFRGETETELADFWPYVFQGAVPEDEAARYSSLMARSQGLVAEDTLAAVSLNGAGTLLDVGGGTGAFLEAALKKTLGLQGILFDLPAVVPPAESRFATAGLTDRVTLAPGSFRDDPLPEGADVISLIRVCYDHEEDTVRGLLDSIFAALPPEGRLIISEPMTGGPKPHVSGDVYFQLYTLAMRTGRTRSQAELSDLARDAGFETVKTPRARRPFVTSVVVAVRG